MPVAGKAPLVSSVGFVYYRTHSLHVKDEFVVGPFLRVYFNIKIIQIAGFGFATPGVGALTRNISQPNHMKDGDVAVPGRHCELWGTDRPEARQEYHGVPRERKELL
jgi:hypothetical protein